MIEVDYDEFPVQKVPNAKKKEAEWYAKCCDWIIAHGKTIKEEKDLEDKYNMLAGNIPDKFYKKILNPYNATNERYKRFPATMRNYDLFKGIIRRYIGEYLKNPHYFIVGANNPEVILAKNAKLRQELKVLVEQAIAARIKQNYEAWVNQGNNPEQFNPQEGLDIEAFIKEFNENYIDDISAQGQELFEVIKDITEDSLLYAEAYFNFIAFGETYTYTDVIGNQLIKRVVKPIDAYPIPSDNIFREDDDMFCERRRLTYQQIIDEFDDYLDEKQRAFLENYYGKSINDPSYKAFTYSDFENYFPDICKKYNDVDRNFFRETNIMTREDNNGLYDVWHVVWKGYVRRAVVTFVNEIGMMDTRVENDDYELNLQAGDIDIEYIYEPQVYESVRIGTRNDSIYPYGARAIAYNRNGKLPYNGISELLPGFGKFSIIDIITPYQIFYNIVHYHQEMVLAKNKINIVMMAKSLLGQTMEQRDDTLYRILADGTFVYDDTTDAGALRAQQVRVLNTNIGDYIRQLSELLENIKQEANEQVDMTQQRYGEIANSAGKGVTEEAVMRGSMGTVLIEFMMDSMRERDYNRDLDFSKFAWIDGLNTSYRDEEGNIKYISLDVDMHNYASYIIKVKNSIKEMEKLKELKNFAFSAAQNGDNMMAIAAIEGDNVASISKLIRKFQDEKNAHEEQLKQLDQENAEMIQQYELQKIQAKGEEDRKTKELEGLIDKEIELIRADSNMISYKADLTDTEQNATLDRLNTAKAQVERDKVNIERQKMALDMYNKEKDRELKRHDIDTKLKIAKQNKNKYDSKSKK